MIYHCFVPHCFQYTENKLLLSGYIYKYVNMPYLSLFYRKNYFRTAENCGERRKITNCSENSSGSEKQDFFAALLFMHYDRKHLQFLPKILQPQPFNFAELCDIIVSLRQRKDHTDLCLKIQSKEPSRFTQGF